MKKATDKFRFCRIGTYRREQLKHLPNIITFLRFPLSIAMLVVSPFSSHFWILYLCSGLTDILDGFLVRKLHQESALGAKLDSIADFVFVGCLTIFAVKNLNIPRWLWLCGLRFTGIILCTVAFISACEELVIIIKSKELNRDCKGILFGKSKFSGG